MSHDAGRFWNTYNESWFYKLSLENEALKKEIRH